MAILKIEVNSDLHYFKNGIKISGPNPDMWGDHSKLSGDCSGLSGECSGLSGHCSSRLWGHCTGLIGLVTRLAGNLNHITEEMRRENKNIRHYIED